MTIKVMSKNLKLKNNSELFDEVKSQEEIVHLYDRRTFLKLAGFTFAGAMVAGCQQGNVEKAIPYLIKPEEITPGLSYWYTTICSGCTANCGVLVKNRDGRPIKLEGNPDHPISKGGLCAVGQAMVLSLYDSKRLLNPLLQGKETDWETFDANLKSKLEEIKKSDGSVRFLSNTIISPTTNAAITKFLSQFKNSKHVVYDPLSNSAILDSHKVCFGTRVLPKFNFEKAEVIVSIDADFLATWISPVEFTNAYRSGRKLDGKNSKFSYHVQVESRVSLTGSNADKRISVSPNDYKDILLELINEVEKKAGVKKINIPIRSVLKTNFKTDLIDRLWKSKGKSLIICGLNDIQLQILTNYLNSLLENYGTTLNISFQSNQLNGNDKDLAELQNEVESGKVSALFIYGLNPAYDLPDAKTFSSKLNEIPVVVTFADRLNETAEVSNFICPEPHMLESWNDSEQIGGIISIQQPAIQPFGKVKSLTECLSSWSGQSQSSIEIIKEVWKKNYFKFQTKEKDFQKFWNEALQNGYAEYSSQKKNTPPFSISSLSFVKNDSNTNDSDFRLVLYPKLAILDGRHAHNPWLQELPDPVTKIVWDNYASVSQKTASEFNLLEGDVVYIQTSKGSLELPVHIQPGQHDKIVAVALGYGRKGTDRFTDIGPNWLEAKPTVEKGNLVGKNAFVFLKHVDGNVKYSGSTVKISKTGKKYLLASTQEHHSLQEPENVDVNKGKARPIVQKLSFEEYLNVPSSQNLRKAEHPSLWPEEHKYEGHHWGMSIDLSACTGCSACVVGCIAENNIPVVGKDEVHRNRELTWIRIDRYYDEENEDLSISHQPMLCHHCDNAPCETVCPVLATIHSEEGLNQQVYNRCVGTRYCSNNCPYKVRRFNWFDYDQGDDMHRLVLNPDVTVRERGIMEKCSFCIQRIQEAKIDAKSKGIDLKDGDIQPACQQSCPAQAITFGDMNESESLISKQMKDSRYYRVLDELGVRPSVGYLKYVKDRNEEEKVNG
ncbi:MAG: 4Fe-4S dicluster domain-containing protein [Bacteroidetes bacterium]|nr:4Fe-4S dicluster domain-containing protein [Bacteroidota bacterium]